MIFSLDKSLLKNSAILITGTVIAQAIPLLLQPILRRFYTTEEFGALAIYTSIFGVVTIASSLRYEAAIMLPKNNYEAANILSLSICLSILVNLFLFLVLIFFYNQFASFIGLEKKYCHYLLFLPISALAFGVYQAVNQWLIRQQAFKASSVNKINRRASEGIIQLSGGFFKLSNGLLWGDLAGNMANLFSGVYQLNKTGFRTKHISFKRMLWALKKYRKLPFYNTLPTLATSIGSTIPYLFINKFYSTHLVALVDLSRLALSVPLVFVSSTLSQVLFQQITQKRANHQPIATDLLKVALIMLTIVLAEFLVIFFLGPFLFQLIFGEVYRASGEISKILIFSFGLNFFTATFSFIIIVFDRLKLYAVWQITYLAAMSTLYFAKNFTFSTFIKQFVFIDALWQFMLLILFFVTVKNYKPKGAL